MNTAFRLVITLTIFLISLPSAYALEKGVSWNVTTSGFNYAYTAYLPDEITSVPDGKCKTLDKVYRTYLEAIETQSRDKMLLVTANPAKIAKFTEEHFKKVILSVANRTDKSAAIFFHSCNVEKNEILYKSWIYSIVKPLEENAGTEDLKHYTKKIYTVSVSEKDGEFRFNGVNTRSDSKLEMTDEWLH